MATLIFMFLMRIHSITLTGIASRGEPGLVHPPPLPLNQDYASFVLFTDAILNVLVVKFDKKYI